MKRMLAKLISFLPRVNQTLKRRIVAVIITTPIVLFLCRLVWGVFFPGANFTEQHICASLLISFLSALGLRLAYEIFHDEDIRLRENQQRNQASHIPRLSKKEAGSYDRLREDVLQHFRSAFDRLAEVEQLSNFIDRRIKSWVQRHWVMSLVSGFMIPIALVISLPLYIPKVVVNYIGSRAAQMQVDELIRSKYGEITEQIEVLDLETKATANASYECLTRLIEMSRDKTNPSRAEKAKIAIARIDRHYDNQIRFQERYVRDASEWEVMPGYYTPIVSGHRVPWDLALAEYAHSINKEDYDNTEESVRSGVNDCLADFLCRQLESETNNLWRAQALLSAVNQIRARGEKKRLLLSEREELSAWRNNDVAYSARYRVETEGKSRWYEPFSKLYDLKDGETPLDVIISNYNAFKEVVRSKPDSYFLACLFYVASIAIKEEDVFLEGGVEKKRLIFVDNREIDFEFLKHVIEICRKGTEDGYLNHGPDYSSLEFRIALEQCFTESSTNTLDSVIKARASNKIGDKYNTLKLIFATLNKHGKRLSDFPDLDLKAVFPTWGSVIDDFDVPKEEDRSQKINLD